MHQEILLSEPNRGFSSLFWRQLKREREKEEEEKQPQSQGKVALEDFDWFLKVWGRGC